MPYADSLRGKLRKYLDLRPDKQPEQDTIANIRADAAFRGANLWVLIFAIFTASLGLNVNSTAVIIGAMLISPLMGPIVGMGLAVGIGDIDLLRSSAKNFGVATLVSVLTAMVYFLISPYKEAQSELLARTAPTLYDVMIAFFGGAAGIVGIAKGGKGNVIPGVAIATALMPPLCTAGYGLATGQWLFFLGAFYLFSINTVFISLATFIGVRLMGFKEITEVSPERARRTKRVLAFVVVVTMVPAAVITVDLIRQSFFKQSLANFADAELRWPGTQIISQQVFSETRTIRVALIGHEVSEQQIDSAAARLADYHLAGYRLDVIQGTQSDSLLALVGKLESSKTDYARTSVQQKWQIHELETQLEAYESLTHIAEKLRPELRILYPDVQTLSLARTLEVRTDTALSTPLIIAVVGTDDRRPLPPASTTQLAQWLATRIETDSVRVLFATE